MVKESEPNPDILLEVNSDNDKDVIETCKQRILNNENEAQQQKGFILQTVVPELQQVLTHRVEGGATLDAVVTEIPKQQNRRGPKIIRSTDPTNAVSAGADFTDEHSVSTAIDAFLTNIGLDWLQHSPSSVTKKAVLRFSGAMDFEIPLPYHKCITNNMMIVLAADTRSALQPTLGAIANNFTTHVVLPDEPSVSEPFLIVTPSPVPAMIDLGVIKLILFVRCF
jgi:hypothetical protein